MPGHARLLAGWQGHRLDLGGSHGGEAQDRIGFHRDVGYAEVVFEPVLASEAAEEAIQVRVA
jgi:hypothetical protein